MKVKDIFALHLRQYAKEMRSLKNAIKRLIDIDDDDFSPSRYTPSRNTCRSRLDEICGTVRGYSLCVDDVLGLEAGTTEEGFYDAYENNVDMTSAYEAVDSDSGMATAQELDAERKTDEAFADALWGVF